MDWRDWSVVQRLGLFRDRAEELRQTRFLRDTLVAGHGFTLQLRHIPDTQDQYEGTFSIRPYDTEDLRSFLTLFRRFFLQDDPVVNLFSIYNLCHRYLTDETHKVNLAKSREIATSALKTSAFHLRIDERDMTPELVSKVWINGYYLHDNIEYYTFLNSLPPETHMMLHIYFFNYLQDMTQQILYTSNVVNAALDEGSIQ